MKFAWKWYPKDVIALVALVICGVLLALGYNHLISTIFAAIIAVYIGIDIPMTRRRK